MLETIIRNAIRAMWLGWALYWLVAARGAKMTRRREASLPRLIDGGFLLLAAFLLLARELLPPLLNQRVIAPGPALLIIGATLTAAGLGFSIWARVHLGRNWSGAVALKDEHALIRSGPYARLRHPIYSGVLLALFGAVLAIGEGRVALAFILVLAGFVRRALAEEAHLREIFPDYDHYRAQTAALIPFVF